MAQAVVNVDSFVVNNLSIDPLSYLNIQTIGGYGIATATPYDPDMFGYVQNGYASGAWNGVGGINSSQAAGDPYQILTVAYMSGQSAMDNLWVSFHGHPIAATDTLMSTDYYGDTNMQRRGRRFRLWKY